MSRPKLSSQIQYSDPDDRREVIVNELVKILSVMIGLGAVPLLERRVAWFWTAGLVAGILAAGAGLYFIRRRQARARQTQPGPRSTRLARLRRGLQNIGRLFARVWGWLRRRWPFGRRAPEAALAPPPPAPPPTSEPDPPGLMAALRGQNAAPVVLLPYLTLWMGIFILIPSLVAAILQRLGFARTDLVLVYFSSPAILVWIAGEGFYFFPRFSTRPRRAPEILGILKSLLVVLSAALLWIFLGLEIGTPGVDWMHQAAIGLALLGALMGLAAESRRRAAQPEKYGTPALEQPAPGPVA